MAAIVRKRGTGEKGNGGEFGTITRCEADVQVDEPHQQVHQESEGDQSGPTLVIPTWAVERAEHKVELANRRLEREGITERFDLEREDGPIEHRAPTPTEVHLYACAPGQMYSFQYTEITLNRPSISHDGWQFAAALDRVPGTDEFMMRSAPGQDFGGWRPEPRRCDHCGTFRDRNTTYLVTDPDTGQTLQVGASCMEAFLSIQPKGLWTFGLAGDDLHEDDDGSAPLSSMTVTDNRDLIAEALVASEMGKRCVSRSRSEEWGTRSTPDRIGDLFGSTRFRRLTVQQRAERDKVQAQLQEGDCRTDR